MERKGKTKEGPLERFVYAVAAKRDNSPLSPAKHVTRQVPLVGGVKLGNG